jgi:hypothetical protein
MKIVTFITAAMAIVLTIGSSVAFSQNKTKKEAKAGVEKAYSLLGKKGRITFPEMVATVEYRSETELHWEVLTNKGEKGAGDETISYQELNDHLHFLNWIEKSGFTVSQVIDTKKGTVRAFWSFGNEKSVQGKRSSMWVEGKFDFIK